MWGLAATCNAQTTAQLGADIDGEAEGDQSGWSVSLSSDGQTVAIGAPLNDGTGSAAGHVRVYAWSGSAWVQRGTDIDGETAGDFSGFSVSLSSDGQSVAIGAYRNSSTAVRAGHVRVYAWSGSAWVQQGADIDGEAVFDESGYSVSLSSDGQTVAIGAWLNDGTDGAAGHVRVYAWNGSAWVQLGADIDGEAVGDVSGSSVSLAGDGQTVAIGAPFNDGTGDRAGHVRVYAWNGSVWGQQGADIDGEAADDRSGSSVSLSSDGQTVAIGARLNDSTGPSAGHVRVYAWNGSSWVQRGADIDGEAEGDDSGVSVSLSSDGQTVAIGAPFNDDTGSSAGHVRVYAWNGSEWEQQGPDIDGEAVDNESGYAVSLSSNGQTVAIGAISNDDTGSNAGHVRVFQIVSTVPDAPTIDSVTVGDGEATIAFSPPFVGAATITSYTVTSNPGGLTASCSTSPCTVTGLTNGQSYTFTVTATNPEGTGLASAASNAVTPEEITQTGLPVWLLYEVTKD